MSEKKMILILDDEPHVVTYLSTLLEDHGYETEAAFNGIEGMQKIKEKKPDLITLDITMPEQSGIRFYRELRDNPEWVSIPVIVVTAVTGYGGDPEPFEKFLSTRKQIPPPEGFLSKPIDQKEFMDLVNQLI
jgi:CheY-like chemotaxis protein